MSATYAPATATERRVSLSRGPALIVGTILLAAGLYFMYRQHTYPSWSNFPNGAAPVAGHAFGIFGLNGFTGLLTAIGGGLLLFGAAEHYLAKTMSLIVGVALGAAAIISLVSGNVLGLAAANGWTELGWGIAAAILLINALIPAHRRRVGVGRGAVAGAAAAAAAGDVAARRRERREAPVAAGAGAAGAGAGTAAGAGTGAGTAAPAQAGTPAQAGAGTAPAGEGAAQTGAGADPAAMEAGGQRGDVNYTRRITGSPNGPANGQVDPAQAEPVGASSGTGSGGGPFSRLFGRRS